MFYPHAVWKKKINILMLNKCLWTLKKNTTCYMWDKYDISLNSCYQLINLFYGKVPNNTNLSYDKVQNKLYYPKNPNNNLLKLGSNSRKICFIGVWHTFKKSPVRVAFRLKIP